MQGAGMLREIKSRPAKEKAERKKPDLKKGFLWLRRRLPAAGAFFLFSLAECLSVPSPYAVCCLSALLWNGAESSGAVMGLGVGALFRLLWGLNLDAGLFGACAACVLLKKIPWKQKHGLYLMTGAALLLRSLPGMLTAPDTQTLLLSGVGMLLGMAMMPALKRGAQLLQSGAREWTEDDLLCLLLPALLLIAGAARLEAFGANIGYMASVISVLMLAWTAGSAAGILGGMGSGLALLLGGQGALPLVNLAFGAMTAGLFQRKNRLLLCGVYLLSSVTMTYLTALTFQPQPFFAALAAALLFALIPRRWARAAAGWLRSIRWNQPRENAYIRLKMQRWVRSIDRMADALPHPRLEKARPEEEGEALMEALCEGCDRLPVCWHENYKETRENIDLLLQREEREDALPLINRYFSMCPRISRIPPILNRLTEDRQRRAHRAVCAEYERDMLQTHLTALSQAAQRISLEGLQGDGEEAYWIDQADEALEALRFPGKTAFVKKIDGRMTVCVKTEPLTVRMQSDAALSRQVGTYLRADLEVTEKSGSRILLEEMPPLRAITGMATACAVTLEGKRKKPRPSPDNGDAVLMEPLTGGRMVLALSDGMGHGTGAQDESRKTLEMLSLCLEAGYSRAQAMTAVNGVMLSAAGGEKFATVDLCLIDLWTGEAVLNKLGACASILVQGQKTQWIQGEALPLGIIEHVIPMEYPVKLGEGDLLILMSDGITDAYPSEEEILAIVKQRIRETPQRMADALLKEAIDRSDGLPPDDMTVLCARIEGRKKE